jgi:hypothetical protein
MRAIAIIIWYLGAGSLVVAQANHEHMQRCPNDPTVKTSDAAPVIALWPAMMFTAVLIYYWYGDGKTPACKVDRN